jgi:hypothetical protein
MNVKRHSDGDSAFVDTKGDSSIETKPRKSSKRARKDCNEDIEDIHKSLWKPDNWETVLENIRLMRKNRDAPVDSMGAEKCADQDAPPKVNFEILKIKRLN